MEKICQARILGGIAMSSSTGIFLARMGWCLMSPAVIMDGFLPLALYPRESRDLLLIKELCVHSLKHTKDIDRLSQGLLKIQSSEYEYYIFHI